MKVSKNGFTLVELVIVIVLLGILATVAAPKFLDLTTDAHIGRLEGMKGAIASGTALIRIQALVDNQLEGAGSIDVNGVTITLYSGYPTGYWQNSMRYIPSLDDVSFTSNSDTKCAVEWCGKGNQTSISSGVSTAGLQVDGVNVVIGKVYPTGYSFNDECGVYFINYLAGDTPTIALETNDC